MPCPFPSDRCVDLEEATERRTSDRDFRAQRVRELKQRDPELSVSILEKRTGYGRTFIVDVLAETQATDGEALQ